MSVPSNLVPTSILQLPEDPAPSDLGWMIYVNNGVTYRVQVNAVLNVSGVPSTRTITAGAGLTGGGDLSANRTFAVAVGGIGSTQLDNTGVTPGVYGSSTALPILTVDANGRVTAATTTSFSVSGFVPDTRQVIAGTGLSGGGALNANVTLNAVFSSATPLALGAATAGTADIAARQGHVHPAVNLASTVETTGVLGMVSGGTGVAHTAPAAGSIAYSDGSGIQLSTVGLSGQVLVSAGAGAPGWGSALIVSDQPANYFYAGPTTGPDAPTAFRALVNADLPNSGVTVNTYGSASSVPVFAVNVKGVVTGVTNTTIAIGNANLANSAITINGNSVSLGGSTTVTATATNALTIGTGLSGTSYNGSSPITVAIDATVATLTGSQILTNKSISGATNTLSAIPNSSLSNSAVTIGTTAISLGASSTTLAGLTSVGSTSFTGALTGNASTATTLETARNIAGVSFNGSADIAIPLANLSDTAIATPTVDQILKYNGTAWVNGAANSISGGSGVEFFDATPIVTATGTNNTLQIATLSQQPVTTAEQTKTTTTINGTVAASAWISPALGRTTIDAGIWDYTVYAGVSSIGGVNTTINRQMYAALPFVTGTVTTTGTGTSRTATASAGTPFATTEIDASATNTTASYLQTPQGLYQITARTSDTVVTITVPTTYTNESAVAGTVWKKLFGGLTTPNLTTTIAQYDVTTTQGSFTVTAATKLGAITFATSTGVRTVTTIYDGTARNTHVASPLAVLHNQLGGLQGGTSNEYYHMTSVEYTGSGTGVFARAASPTFTGTLTCATLVATTGISGGTF